MVGLTACSSQRRPSGETKPDPDPDPGPTLEIPYPLLSDYDLFEGDLANLKPTTGVLPYQVIAPLWSDGALKSRFVKRPKDEPLSYVDDGDWGLPEGTIVVKDFAFEDETAAAGLRHIETRLLIQQEGHLTSHVYLWNDEQTDARRHVAGKRVDVGSLEYIVPNTEQCDSCHDRDDEGRLLGLVTRQVRREVSRDGKVVDQIAWLASAGLFGGAVPDPQTASLSDPYDESGEVKPRARSWLHANCAHCHQPGGGGGKTGLVLHVDEMHPTKLGICKSPVAAGSGAGGLKADIVPGYPEQSIMIRRITSTEPEVKMPEIPNRLVDEAGAELISSWIAAMEPKGCSSASGAGGGGGSGGAGGGGGSGGAGP